MAKNSAKATAPVITKADPKRDRTIKNRERRLEAHLKRFPEDAVAKAALGREKPARKTPKNKGSFPKAVIRISEPVCETRVVGTKYDKAQGKKVDVTKNGSGFVSAKHKVGTILRFGSTEPILVESVGKSGRPGWILNPEVVAAWDFYIEQSKKVKAKSKRRG